MASFSADQPALTYGSAISFRGTADEEKDILDQVSHYYGRVLNNSADLKTNSCCTFQRPTQRVADALNNIHTDVKEKYYGCGFVAPERLEGLKVLDLGCGAGRDCYILSQLVGESGEVVGVDMTDEQLNVAQTYQEWHRVKFGYAKSNIKFVKGHIEQLDEILVDDQYFDLIVSNCVINLSPNKAAVFKQAYRLLKEGGEVYFSDIYADRRLPDHVRNDETLWGECLAGALYWNDFNRLVRSCGFQDPRLVSDQVVTINNRTLQRLVQNVSFYSATYRLWKLEGLEPDCEDYGQAVMYLGSPEWESSDHLDLDGHHRFFKNKIMPVCGNTFLMLKNTRYASCFQFYGDFRQHFGIFPDCGKTIPFHKNADESQSKKSCC